MRINSRVLFPRGIPSVKVRGKSKGDFMNNKGKGNPEPEMFARLF